MKIELELDWLYEDYKFEDAIKDAIINKMAEKLSKELYPTIEKEVSSQLAKTVDDLQNKLIDRFMNKEVIVTDNWGDVQTKHENVNELLKHKFDKFLTEKVNDRGEPSSSCGYGANKTYTRIDFFIDERIKLWKKSITDSIAKQMDEKLTQKKQELMTEASKKIAEKLGVY